MLNPPPCARARLAGTYQRRGLAGKPMENQAVADDEDEIEAPTTSALARLKKQYAQVGGSTQGGAIRARGAWQYRDGGWRAEW